MPPPTTSGRPDIELLVPGEPKGKTRPRQYWDQTLPNGARTADLARVMSLLEGLSATEEVHVVAVDGEPLSKGRPRFGKHRTYTPAATRSAEEALALRLLQLPTFPANVAVACLFYRSSRQRIDVDNLLKLVLDGCTAGRMWADDSQVTALLGVLEFDADHPRSVIAFGRHQSTMARGENALTACERCGKLYNGYGVASRRHCSAACREHLSEPVPCPSCGDLFKRKTTKQKYCSVACRGRAHRAPREARACESCGARVSKAGYRQCRECWLRSSA